MLNITTKKTGLKPRRLKIETILNLATITLVASLFLKAVIDIDNAYDPGWYHLPFAGRIWGILPKEMFIGDDEWFEPRFEGFPLLAHFLQGFFWKITGRIQSANLVSFFAIFGYFFFLKSFFKVPFYLSVVALFSIPLVLLHTTTSFVDLLGNAGVSMLIMIGYSFYTKKELPQKKELFVAFLGAAIAANTKTLLQPLTLIALLLIGIRLGWLYYQQRPAVKLNLILPISLLTILIIFTTPVKNTLVYGNPLYPIRLEIAGVVLNHKRTPKAFEEGNRQLNWLGSVLDIETPRVWTADQWSPNPLRRRRGGFFGAYVVFNLVLLGIFFVDELIQNKSLPRNEHSNQAQLAVLTVIVLSLLPLNFPASHELRYFIYWMISLVSLNLYLVTLPKNSQFLRKWFQVKSLRWIYLIFLIIVLSRVGHRSFFPVFNTLDKYVAFGVNQEFLSQIQPNDRVCLISQHMGDDIQTSDKASLKYAFIYSSYFHPELGYDYSVEVGGYYPNHAAFAPKEICGDRKIIPGNLK